MTRDRDKTLSLAETLDEKIGEELDQAMRTTLVQPIRWQRQPDLAKTRYWQRLSLDREEPKPPASSYGIGGNTRIGLGPDDEIQRAVRAAKSQRVEAESHGALQPRIMPAEADLVLPSQAKTMRLPALGVLPLVAAKVQAHLEARRDGGAPEPRLPAGRRPRRPLVLGLAAISVMLSVVSVSYLVPAGAPRASDAVAAAPARPSPQPAGERTAQAEREPERAPAAAEPTGAAAPAAPIAVQAAMAPAANAPAAPQTTEKAAVDALFAGDYALAGRHYAALARGRPEQPAFAEAARILRRNAAAEAE